MRKKKKFVVRKGGGSRFIGTAVRSSCLCPPTSNNSCDPHVPLLTIMKRAYVPGCLLCITPLEVGLFFFPFTRNKDCSVSYHPYPPIYVRLALEIFIQSGKCKSFTKRNYSVIQCVCHIIYNIVTCKRVKLNSIQPFVIDNDIKIVTCKL